MEDVFNATIASHEFLFEQPHAVGWNPSSTLPLVVGIDVHLDGNASPSRHYYFWFFGNIAKLPYERENETDMLTHYLSLSTD